MSDEIALVTRACAECGFPIHAPADAPCPYCARSQPSTAGELHAALYGLQWAELSQLKAAPDDAPLATIVDVLLALYVVSEEPATPGQLTDVIDKVLAGRLDDLPLPRRSTCFCGSGDRYKKCHGR